MSGPRGYASAYRNTALDGAGALSQQRQLAVLLSGVVQRVDLARQLLQRGDIVGKANAISSLFPLLESLRGSLDFEAGGALAENLATLYDTASVWLAEANARNDTQRLLQVRSLLEPVARAFNELPEQGER